MTRFGHAVALAKGLATILFTAILCHGGPTASLAQQLVVPCYSLAPSGASPLAPCQQVTATVPLPVVSGAAPTMTAASSGNVANASASATLAAVPGATRYVTGFSITASGATAATVVTATLSGLAGGSLSYTFPVPAGATAPATPLVVNFASPLPASAQNTAIAITLPALGAGNTNAAVTIHGFSR